MISTITTTTVTTVTTVTSAVGVSPIGAFSLVSALALVGYLCTREVLGAKRNKGGFSASFLYIGVVPLSIAFSVWAVVKVLSAVRL
ncbi:MAG: hypothetical protein HY671_09670 [Chloroflexi bacterium]|nr:hypothetical protein [Chloroflexota bacterium]